MAGITCSFHWKPIFVTRTSSAVNQPYYPLPVLSSYASKLFGLRLYRFSNVVTLSRPGSSVFLNCVTVVNARYGGPSSSAETNRSRGKESDEEKALDVSSIRSANVRLLDEQQNMVGVVPKEEALRMADEAELDLVIVSPDADPPVVRIMDFSKYAYEVQKKKRGNQKRSSASRMDLKELKMGYNINQHDYDVRLKAACKFLKEGDKVKVIVNLKGRENEFRNNAIELIRRFQNDVGELATEESKNFRERSIFITLTPNKAVIQKAQEPSKKKDKSAADEVSADVGKPS